MRRLKAEQETRRKAESRRKREANRARWPSPLDMAAELDPPRLDEAGERVGVWRTPALDLINAALVDLAEGRESRLAAMLSPQEGKSTLVSFWFVLWLLSCINADLRVLILSYSDEMARRWGGEIKDAVERWSGDEGTIDLGLRLRKDSRAAGRWNIAGHKGSVYCSGVAGSITGKPADCLRGDSRIITECGYIPIRKLYEADGPLPRVLSFNHTTGGGEWRDIVARRAIADRPLVEVVTADGRTIQCTPDHRIYSVDRGYVAAADLVAGERLVAAGGRSGSVCELRDGVYQGSLDGLAGSGRDADVMLAGMPRDTGPRQPDLRRMRNAVHASAMRGRKGAPQRVDANVLLKAMFSGVGVKVRRQSATLRDVWPAAAGRSPQKPVLLSGMQARFPDGQGRLHDVLDRVFPAAARVRQEAAGQPERLLLAGVLCGRHEEPRTAVQGVRRTDRLHGSPQVLLRKGLPARGEPGQEGARSLPSVRGSVLAKDLTADVLRPGLRQYGPCRPHGGRGQLALQGRDKLRRVVPADASIDPRTRRSDVPSVRGTGPDGQGAALRRGPVSVDPCGPPHQREALGESPGEPDRDLSVLPHNPSQVGYDTVSVVRELRGTRDIVYDLQVDGNSNFFADEVLVHNCVVVDDPLKNMEEAQSEKYRERAMSVYRAVLVPRLGPGAKMVWVQTCWHESEPIRQILANEGDKVKGGRWRVISIPAIAEDTNDPLGRRPGEGMVSARGQRDWQQIRKDVGEYVFGALYQQRPAPAEGNVFRRVWWRYWRSAPRIGPSERLDLGGRICALDDCWRFATVDLANSTKTSGDWTVIAAWARTLSGDLVLLDRTRARIGEAEHFTHARPLVERWKLDTLFVEESQFGTTLVREATQAGVPISPLRAETDKVTRALPASAWCSAGRVWLPAGAWWEKTFVDELAGFPNSAHDDQVDCLAYAVRVAVTKWAPPHLARPPTTSAERELDFDRVDF